ncbi:hypothetical protein [Saccharopolyspora gloriosae]|uniref:hypothetical protein n=1 Tax=Saccharopolyspora gloriosae TaxID=455344 RepID=UPI001FB6FF3F|nr:hypothetical protein [Saccharopolyspora gloriosae]
MAYWGVAAGKDLDVLSVVNPVLKELRDATGETASFFRSEGEHRVCVAVAETRHALRRSRDGGAAVGGPDTGRSRRAGAREPARALRGGLVHPGEIGGGDRLSIVDLFSMRTVIEDVRDWMR